MLNVINNIILIINDALCIINMDNDDSTATQQANETKPETTQTGISSLLYSKEQIIEYLTGEYKQYNENIDISYNTWVLKEESIQILCKEIEIPNNKEKAYEKIRLHDFDCELRLLKWITEDKAHRDKLTSMPNNSEQYNRFPDLIPCKYISIILI